MGFISVVTTTEKFKRMQNEFDSNTTLKDGMINPQTQQNQQP